MKTNIHGTFTFRTSTLDSLLFSFSPILVHTHTHIRMYTLRCWPGTRHKSKIVFSSETTGTGTNNNDDEWKTLCVRDFLSFAQCFKPNESTKIARIKNIALIINVSILALYVFSAPFSINCQTQQKIHGSTTKPAWIYTRRGIVEQRKIENFIQYKTFNAHITYYIDCISRKNKREIYRDRMYRRYLLAHI